MTAKLLTQDVKNQTRNIKPYLSFETNYKIWKCHLQEIIGGALYAKNGPDLQKFEFQNHLILEIST